MDPLPDRWRSFMTIAFPRGWAGVEVDGVDLGLLDSLAAGCIASVVESGQMDAERLVVLRECDGLLQRAIPNLQGEPLVYFSELAALAKLALDRTGHRVDPTDPTSS